MFYDKKNTMHSTCGIDETILHCHAQFAILVSFCLKPLKTAAECIISFPFLKRNWRGFYNEQEAYLASILLVNKNERNYELKCIKVNTNTTKGRIINDK
jgi:hypothetical protein